MQKIFRFLEIALISLTLSMRGFVHCWASSRRPWIREAMDLPLFFALLPAFCIRACLRYVFKQKSQNT